MSFEGKAWVFGDDLNTDVMYPGFAMKLPIPEAARFVFEAIRPGWTTLVRPGDIVIGGRNFGLGSSRPVPLLLKQLGVTCVIAVGFNSLFVRNCINLGFPCLTVPSIKNHVEEGQALRVNVEAATVELVGQDNMLTAEKYPEFILEILRNGGILPKLEAAGLLKMR